MRIAETTIKQTVLYIAHNHERYMKAAQSAGYPVDAVRIEANNAFQQITGISLVFVNYDSINSFCADKQQFIWRITDQYNQGGFDVHAN